MKLATFRSGGQDKIGLVHGNNSRLFDLAAAADRNGKSNPAFASMLALIDAGPAALDQANAQFEDSGNDKTLSVAVASVEILAPIPEPRQMRDGMSFPLHILQAPRGQLKLAARAKNDMAELKRIEAEPLGELPEIYRKQPIYYITNRFSSNTASSPRTREPTSRLPRPKITSSATPSSTIFRRGMPSALRWRAALVLPKARALMAATSWAPGS